MKISLFVIVVSLVAASSSVTRQPAEASQSDTLAQTISQLDSEVFDAFNLCADPAQLQRHAGFFSESVEFYHDKSGVTWNRADMLANTKKHACGNYTREVIPGSLVVHPIKGYGAIELGTHRFCQSATRTCDGLADFTMVWQQTDAGWRITRVLSYGHRANPDRP
jgi:hypothetical protein